MASAPNQLLLPREPMALDESLITRPKNLLRAFVMAADLGGFDDKQAAAAAGMDPSTWAQFKNGDRGIKPLLLNSYLDQVGNELPLAYWAFTRGYELKHRETELERQLRAERQEKESLRAENTLLRNLVQGRAT